MTASEFPNHLSDDGPVIRDAAEFQTVPRSSIAAAIVGNVLEFYDFTVYSFFAVFIGRAFFPAHDPYASLLFSVVTFGLGFLTRPLGAAVIGAYADRAGRSSALLLTISLMGLGMVILAFTPSFASIGVLAPVLVVVARLIQGFALGGEVGAASAYLIEAVPESKRGAFGGWQVASQGASTLLAGIVGTVLSGLLPDGALESWGWRIAFFVGLTVVPVGFIMRRTLPETLVRPATRPATLPTVMTVVRHHPRTLILGILACMGATVSIYTLNYMTTYAISTLHLSSGVALTAPLVNGVCTLGGALFGGWLSDRFGRKPLLILPRIALLLLAYPLFIVLSAAPSATTLLIATGVLTLLNAPSAAVTAVIIPESFPPQVRSSGFALAYALAVTIFGGTTQVVVTWLIAATGDPLAPAGYMVVACAVGVIAMAMMPETHRVRAPEDELIRP